MDTATQQRKRANELVWTVSFRYSCRKIEMTAQDRAG